MADERPVQGGVLYAEEGDDWSPLPFWAQWFLQLGYSWPARQDRRRICIVSTPCDSPGAALVALGIMRRRLELPEANDLASHLLALRQRIAEDPTGTIVRRVNKTGPKNRWRFSHVDRGGQIWVCSISDPAVRSPVLEKFAFDWQVEGEPPVQVAESAPIQLSELLPLLFPNSAPVLPQNLARTDSAICLAGRAVGENQTRESLSAVRLSQGGATCTLSSLLTIHGWHDGRVSRMTYFNSRTGVIDRPGGAPQVVCVDGPPAFSKVRSEARFNSSDIIAVVPRTAEPDQLDAVTQHLASLAQWYMPEDAAGAQLGELPGGIATLMLRKA